MNCDPHWTSYFSAMLTPTVAILGSFIAYRQWRLAQNKLKLDLFDRRFSVYEAARNFISSIMTSGKAKNEELFKFMVATREAKWLFNSEIAEYLEKELYQIAIKLQTLDSMLEGEPVGEERTKTTQNKGEITIWFNAQYEILDEHFAPFLKLQH